MARRRPTPRLLSKRQRKFLRLPKRYQVLIADEYWMRKYHDWPRIASAERTSRLMAEVERIRNFLSVDRPILKEVELLIHTGLIEITPIGKGSGIVVKPLLPGPPQRVVMTPMNAPPMEGMDADNTKN